MDLKICFMLSSYKMSKSTNIVVAADITGEPKSTDKVM